MLAQRPWIVPIADATKRHRFEDTLRRAPLGLTPDDRCDIGEAASRIMVQAARDSLAAQAQIAG